MNKSFIFDAGDDDDDTSRPAQSPWDFSRYTATTEDEHKQRNTTSVDYKISQIRSKNVEAPNSEEEKEGGLVTSAKKKKRQRASKTEASVIVEEKKKCGYFAPSEGASFNAASFLELNISRPLIRACEALGYKQPTPIQAACIPLALSGRDICGSAVTGSGKTAAFALPLLERLLFRPRRISAIRVLILTPTRELAVQLHSMFEKLAQFTDIRCCLVVGGLSSKAQEVALRTQPDIVIATPGRMIDHLRNTHSVGLEDLAILVLDEADRLLELGFREEIHELVRLCPERRQTMLFSATMTEEVAELVKLSLNSPVRLSADPSTQRPSTLLEEVIKIRPAHEEDKESILLALCSRSFKSKTIIFSGTKFEAHRLKLLFGLSGLKAAELHGNLTQAQRLDALESFRKQDADFLIATDVAARGLDIIGVETVINFECPKDITMYVHRVGRTARAGREGCALTMVTEKDRALLKAMAKRAGSKLQRRIVAANAIASWRQKIDDMESDVAEVIRQEREEKALRKAEMEASKAQNMMDHESEIFSRPKKTWFQCEKDRKKISDACKALRAGVDSKVKLKLSVNDSEKAAKREKRRSEKEKLLPRKKRRRLAAAEEVEGHDDDVDDDEDDDGVDDVGVEYRKEKGKQEKKKLLVDIGYRRAKAVKAAEKRVERGMQPLKKKMMKKKKKKEKVVTSRSDEMHALFQADITNKRSSHHKVKGGGFKSKSRYKRRK